MQKYLDEPLKYKELINQHLKILKNLQYESGLFAASKKDTDTGYNKSWLRDNFYECLAFEVLDDWKTVAKTYHALLNVFKKHESKIDSAIQKKPEHRQFYIHARFHPETFDEFWEEWGNKQNDSIGAILFKIGELEQHKNVHILKTKADKRIVQKLVWYLQAVEYWQDEDSGMWEENEEVHASSVGACVAGLKMLKDLPYIDIPDDLIEKGEATLKSILPRESVTKFVDLSLLSLIYPYNVVTERQTKRILKNVRYLLERNRGVIRYKNDHYYNKNKDGYSEEAEWCFGFSWLVIIYALRNEKDLAEKFVKKMMKTITEEGEVPELYFSNTKKFNKNSPLGWAESLLIVACYEMNKKFMSEKAAE